MSNPHRKDMRKVIAGVCAIILFIIGLLSLLLPSETFAFFLRVLFALVCSIISSYIVTKLIEIIGYRKSKGYHFYLGKFATKNFSIFFSIFTFVLTIILGLLLETVFNNGGALSQWFETASIWFKDSNAYLYIGWSTMGIAAITFVILLSTDSNSDNS